MCVNGTDTTVHIFLVIIIIHILALCIQQTQLASVDYITASTTLIANQHAIAATRYDSDPHTHVHRVFTDMEHPHRCWPHDWTRDQCVMVAQLRMGHSPLLAACIGCRDSATCAHRSGADEMAEHLVLHCTRPGVAGVMAKSPLSKRPKTPMELPGEDRGGDP